MSLDDFGYTHDHTLGEDGALTGYRSRSCAGCAKRARREGEEERIEVVIHLNGRKANYHSPIEVIADGRGTWEVPRFLSEEPADKGGKCYVYSQHTVTVYP